MTETYSTEATLPVPIDALVELGLTAEQIEESRNSRPLVVAFQADQQPGAYFSVEAARRAIKAIESFKHTKGRWGASPLRLAPWQIVWVIAPIFGWLYYDPEADRDVRVIRAAWVEVPRKNGKSTLSSGIGLTLLLADREVGAEVYAAAGSLPQAERVFDDAKRMALTSHAVRGRAEVLRGVIRVPRTGGVFRALSKVAETAHGLNVSGAIIDEVHVHQKRDLVDAIETGTGARDQPLVVFITTADEGEEGSIYDEKHTYTRRIAENVVSDPGHYGVIWAAEEGDDPFDEATWRKANPGLGTSPSLAYMRREAAKAKASPSYFPTFCRLSLNRRMRASTRWLPMPLWDANAGMVDDKRFRHRRAWGGVDLSAVSDLSAWVLAVESRQPGVELELVSRFWLPEERVDELENQLQVPLRQWAREGFLTLTEGDAIDYDTIEKQIIADCRRLDVQRISYDRMFAGQLVQRVDSKTRGVDLVPVAQTYLGMGPGSKELERLLREGLIRHGGHPILRWNASCVEIYADGNDNIRPVKPDRNKSSARIDGIAASVMALDGYLRRPIRKARAVSA
ncbi:terminase large subunit [Allostreptomyces psammosilenae]|uniref:Phage terminase large subunit-like protein n=1 Tax=Allostreptomyces psammosilenae TaxID=1892865 RepID=A0A852ZZE5_9ACTN|nr:terminase TerL endonuclease subunit [Allostreptomyces psammosilenae]NYI06064.1 phage terminase large subunit-like protein [Allostreptomyces psammosilenae]